MIRPISTIRLWIAERRFPACSGPGAAGADASAGQFSCAGNDDPIGSNGQRDLIHWRIGIALTHPTGAFDLRAREETRESRGMPCLFLNTERGFGGKPPQKSGFR